MRIHLLAVLFAASSIYAADLSKIERTIKKLPDLKSEKPEFGLIVIGPEAATRHWVVIDGNVLYFDFNSDGDLTTPNEKVAAGVKGFPVGNVGELGSKTIHSDLVISQSGGEWGVVVNLHARRKQWATLIPAAKPEEAQIVHLNGPMTMRPEVSSLKRGRDNDLQCSIGTPGLGEGTFASIAYTDIPKDIHPVAEIEIPGADNQPPMREKIILSKRC
ncbi:MAG TPA: hypothetical protein VEK08_02355 [Planctomycetota bacterium]|nr:hypothetical protein [Planctomycetota bacterium]